MKQKIKSEHRNDKDGKPAGGTTVGTGINIKWQDGPLKGSDGKEKKPNGAFVETVILSAIDRLTYYQKSKFNCTENAEAIRFLNRALEACDRRTRRRIVAGTEGTHKV